MQKISAVLFAIMIIALSVVASADGEKKPVTNQKCPVMNAAVSKDFRSEYKGQYIYFCCAGCVKMFEKDPETYVAKLSPEDREAIKTNDICPVTQDKITDQTRWVEYEGRKVYFCCDGCVDMFKKKMAEKKSGD
jgi:YHS domain-containing protein